MKPKQALVVYYYNVKLNVLLDLASSHLAIVILFL